MRCLGHKLRNLASDRKPLGIAWAATHNARLLATVRASPSREREVQTACAALAESVQAGDMAWFERVVVQLRSILDERQTEAATEMLSGTSSLSSSGPVRPVSKSSFPVAPRSASSSFGRTQQPLQNVPFKGQTLDQGVGTSIINGQSGQDVDDDQPTWMQALTLLEKAASVPRKGRVSAPPPKSGFFPAKPSSASPLSKTLTEAADLKPSVEARLKAYLDSFEKEQSKPSGTSRGIPQKTAADEEEPGWARAIRLLEAVPSIRSSSSTAKPEAAKVPDASHEHAGEDAVMSRYERLLGKTEASNRAGQDSRKNIRLRSFANMLKETERLAPGASVPVRFPSFASNAKPAQKSEGKPELKPGEVVSPFPKPPPPMVFPEDRSTVRGKVASSSNDPFEQAVGRGKLISSIPTTEHVESEEGCDDNATLRKEDFIWSEHDFNDGDKENKRVLKGFTKEFKKMAAETPEGLRNPRLLTAALDLALACVKCYELDKADAIYRRAIGECRRRGLPWDVKCIQDMATLRCKQHRQADAAELLEELATKAPPHPATFINLGTVYNQLRQYEKAESWFLQAVNLKGGAPGREDHWNLGIAKKNMGKYDEALPMLERALSEFQEHEPDHPVTIAKLHSSVGGCLHDMGRFAEAVDQYQQAYDLYVRTVGKESPLFGGAAEGLAKALMKEDRLNESFEALLASFEVQAKCDAVHPTPLFESLEMALLIHGKHSEVSLARMAPLIDAAVQNLDSRGQAEDGNAGLVMCRAAKVLFESGAQSLRPRALSLLERGMNLVRQSHESGEADLSYELMKADMLLHSLRQPLETTSVAAPLPFPRLDVSAAQSL